MLSIEEDLAHRMKVLAACERRDVSTITEELYTDYLKRFETFDVKPKEVQDLLLKKRKKR
jgi:hypothetical protein